MKIEVIHRPQRDDVDDGGNIFIKLAPRISKTNETENTMEHTIIRDRLRLC